jgi:hypothetical protein
MVEGGNKLVQIVPYSHLVEKRLTHLAEEFAGPA